ncbi:SusD/RagB family nutrient-binding outer membrane lipoprotein [Zobellia laminariae]|uniref:SusD/RagB family nutrient-binding outer membrane lipoprotein n=1 Tax=Zobellia laminariae TaxID=248906 RepID=UPI0026F42441|nr:SusD/RagB family nutrient-binding outer membrane lipoprotein [Zobellia laminariae]WKX78345.1 SusD/RagB family nutrient-binding outer membrane lipoprotein [Zobellia laminariae]
MAEAVELGWTSGDASAYYEEGLEASFDLWDAEDANTYISANPLSTDPEIAMKQIAEEKWKALYLQGWES